MPSGLGVAGVAEEHFFFVEGAMADLAMCVFKEAGGGVGGRWGGLWDGGGVGWEELEVGLKLQGKVGAGGGYL